MKTFSFRFGASGLFALFALAFLTFCSSAEKATNSSGEKIVSTPSGLKYVDLKIGDGTKPSVGAEVTIHYLAKLENGKVIDNSYDRKLPFTFRYGAGKVIKGLEEGLATMRTGGKRKLIIPPKLAYGEKGGGEIPPNATLIFIVELLDVR